MTYKHPSLLTVPTNDVVSVVPRGYLGTSLATGLTFQLRLTCHRRGVLCGVHEALPCHPKHLPRTATGLMGASCAKCHDGGSYGICILTESEHVEMFSSYSQSMRVETAFCYRADAPIFSIRYT